MLHISVEQMIYNLIPPVLTLQLETQYCTYMHVTNYYSRVLSERFKTKEYRSRVRITSNLDYLSFISFFANEPAERRRSAGEAAENSDARRMAYAKKFSIEL